MAGNSHPNRTGGDPPSRGRGPSDHLSSSALAHQPPPPNMAVDSHPNRPGGDSPSRGRDRDRGSLTSPPRFLNTGKSKNPACNDAAVVVCPRGGGRLGSPPRFPGTGTGKGKQSETAGAAFFGGRGGPSPSPPFVDKGKQVASEQETPTPSTGFMEDARRGFMADARRAAQPRTAPRPLLASGSTALPPNRSDRGDTTTNFTLRPLGSTVKKPFILDNKIYSKLKHHQKEGLKWLWAIHCCGNGGLLADDMGLGKTFQILAFIAGLIESKLMERAIIAVPAMILDQWVVEMEGAGLKNYIHIFKDIKTRKLEIMKVCQNGGILITTHTLATNKWSMLNISWDYLFIDEAHQTCKKTSLKAYRNLERLECKRRILITGTPAPNSLKEFRAILNFCCPGLFDCMTEFHDSYLAPLVEGNYKDSSPDQLNESSKASKKLQHLIRPCFLRRLKSVLSSVETPEKIRLTLPEKVEFVLWLKLSRYQEKLYRTFLSGDIIDKSNQGEAIVASTVLHKICNHPKNLSNINEDGLDDKERAVLRRMVRKLSSSITRGEDNMSEDPASCKIDIILRLMERFKEQKHKVLIFSHTCEMLDTVEEVLLKKGYLLDRIDGTLNQKVRAKRVQSFQKADGAPILLISSFCAGTGLDLPAASRAIIIEPFWNPSVDDQCADRIYRLSQEKNCIIYRLISSETIEEVVYRTQIFKLGVFKTATENKDFKRYITRKLRNELLAISPNGFGSSRTLQQLEKESTSTLSQEMNEEMNFLKKGDLIGVSIHSELFQGAPIRKTNIPAVSFAPNERIRDLDYAEELRKAAHRRKIEFVEDQIKKYNYTYMNTRSTLPDQGAKCLRMVDRYTKELAELRSSTDPKDNT